MPARLQKPKEPDIKIRLQPKQQEMYRLMNESPATWVGFGGSRGAAKSGGARRVILRRRFEWPGTSGMIFRRTYKELLDNHVGPMWRDFPSLERHYNKTEMILTLPESGGSQIAFRYGENAAAIDTFLGKEFMDVFVDQAEGLTGDELIRLKSSCRWPGVPEHQCNFVLGFNPGGKGSGFLKRIFKQRSFEGDERPDDFAFIQAYGWDNIEWARSWLEKNGISEQQYYSEWTEDQRRECFLKNSSYGRAMLALPEGLRAGWLYGDFDSFAGQYFENFRLDRHAVRSDEMVVKPWFKRWIAVDWGFRHNAVALWFCQAYRRGFEEGEPLIWCYRELVRNRMGSAQFGKAVAEMSGGEEIDAIYVDSGAKSQTDSNDTPYDQLNREFRKLGLPMAGLANKDRVGGWRLMYDLLGTEEEAPKFVISRACERLLSTIPMMSRDKKKVEDCEKFDCNENGEGGDDAAETCRYGLLSRLRPSRKPQSEEMAERLAPIEDFTEKSMMHRRLLTQARRGVRMFRLR